MAVGGLALPLAGCADEAAEEDASDEDNETVEEEDDSLDDDPEEEGDDERDEEDEEAETEDEPDDQEFSGAGDEAIEDVPIEGGLTVVEATHEGENDFEVRLVPEEQLEEHREGDEDDEDEDDEDEDDEEDEELRTLFVETSGAYAGETARGLEEGNYLLGVVADGEWEVTVRQPRDESGESPPVSVSGDGNEVHGPFEFDGTYQPSGDYDGEGVIVHLFSPTGEAGEFLFHEDSIDNPAEFEFDDVGYLAVESDDEWSVEIE